MKFKSILAVLALGVAAMSAQALEVGATFGVDTGTVRNSTGVVVAQRFGANELSVSAERFTRYGNDQNRYSMIAKRDVLALGPVALNVQGGASYLQNQAAPSGYAGQVGVGASLPVAKNVVATLDLRHQFGQQSVNKFNGNTATVGLRYQF